MTALRLIALDGEVLPPGAGLVTVTAALHPLKSQHSDYEVPAGLNILEILDRLPAQSRVPPSVRVFLGRDELPRAAWGRVRPKAGTRLVLTVVPRDGGDGLRIALTLAVIAAVIVAPGLLPAGVAGTPIIGSLTVGGLFAAGVGLAGPVALNQAEAPA